MRRIVLSVVSGAMSALVALAQVGLGGGIGGGAAAPTASLLNGSAAPSNSIGSDGDFYLNTGTHCLYGPKAAGVWPSSCTSLTIGYVAENAANRGSAGGYAPLDSSSKVPAANLPTTMKPSAHASSHQNGGSDEIATVTPNANAIPKAGPGGKLAQAWVDFTGYQTTTGNFPWAQLTGVPSAFNANQVNGTLLSSLATGILKNTTGTGVPGIAVAGTDYMGTSTAVQASQMPALTGDVTTPAGSVATTVGKINGTSLASLATGILKNTAGTGVPSIAADGTDYVSPSTINNATLSASVTTLATSSAATVGGDLNVSGAINANTGSPNPTCIHFTDTNQAHDTVLCAPTTGINYTIKTFVAAPTAAQPITVDSTGQLYSANTLRGASAAPTVACGAGAGTGATCTVAASSTNNAGTVTVVTAGTPSASAAIFTLTFSGSIYPVGCIFSDGSGTTAPLALAARPYNGAVSSGSWTLTSGTTALGVATYVWRYVCM